MTKVAFLVVVPDADSAVHRGHVVGPSLEVITVMVGSYKEAQQVSQDLVRNGVTAIELCGGFGHRGVAAVCEAVPETAVGVVRFDGHPGIEGKSGDTIFLIEEG
jgi:hypothetical protein